MSLDIHITQWCAGEVHSQHIQDGEERGKVKAVSQNSKITQSSKHVFKFSFKSILVCAKFICDIQLQRNFGTQD